MPRIKKEKLPKEIKEEVDIFEPTIQTPDLDSIIEEENQSLLSKELVKFENQIAEIQDTLEEIKLREIDNVEDRLKATIAKIGAMQKLPSLLTALDDLRNKHLLRSDGIKGKDKVLSPLEAGLLDDDDE